MTDSTDLTYRDIIGVQSHQKLPSDEPGDEQKEAHIMSETRTHPEHPVRELALQLATGHRLDGDTAESIVARAEQYATFLSK